jgi:aspartate aminotransferase-like enzyme
VAVRREVRRAFEQSAESHRSSVFLVDFQATQRRLCDLVRARHCELLMGSGTLANDAIAAQLSLEPARGLVLNNGEFGGRLADHARRARLSFDTVEVPWGEAFDLAEIRSRLARTPGIGWLWATHCETSTGVLNDLEGLQALAAEFGLSLCLDCVSSIGTVPVDLRQVWLASGASGKGLGAYPGLAMVFHQHELSPAPERLPRYLDLGYYAGQSGVPFTFSSNLLHALHAAVRRPSWERRFAALAELGSELRARLREAGFTLVADCVTTSPAVVTIALPPELDSATVGSRMLESGFLLSAHSEYLRQRNWIQVCLMGECAREKMLSLTRVLARGCFNHSTVPLDALTQAGARP